MGRVRSGVLAIACVLLACGAGAPREPAPPDGEWSRPVPMVPCDASAAACAGAPARDAACPPRWSRARWPLRVADLRRGRERCREHTTVVIHYVPFVGLRRHASSVRMHVDGTRALAADGPVAPPGLAVVGSLPFATHCLHVESTYRVHPDDILPFVTYEERTLERRFCFDPTADLTLIRVISGNVAGPTAPVDRGFLLEAEGHALDLPRRPTE